MFTKRHKLWLGLALLVLPVLACNLPGQATPNAASTLNPLYTSAAQTLEAMATQGLTTPPTNTSTAILAVPTNTLVFVTNTPVNTLAPVKLCDAAAFVRDVTIPDGALLERDTPFTKTWRLKNVGTCSWTTSYALVFVNGDGLSAPSTVNLGANVNPGETIDVSVNMVTPDQEGHYRGYWKLRNASGVLFGIGTQATTSFWVDINVAGPSYTFYDFSSQACNAVWQNNDGNLPCPGTQGDQAGYVLSIPSPQLENGTITNDPGLLTVPKYISNGYIRGVYPAIPVKNGDHFKALVNCQYNASTCDVLFRFEYRIGNEAVKTLKEWHEIYEGKYFAVDVDLSGFAGQNVQFFLTIYANDSKGDDFALWVYPRIVRQGVAPTPTNTSTATATPTITGTPSATPTYTSTPTETPTP